VKLGFVINDLATEQESYTTILLAMTASRLGHEVWITSVGDFSNGPDDSVHAWGRSISGKRPRTPAHYLAALRDSTAKRIAVDELDVLMLRNDPAADLGTRPWAQGAGAIFGQRAAARGVIVVNDTTALSLASTKLYFETFPAEVRPRSLISRSATDLKKFVASEGGRACLKPLQGSGGTNVFVITSKNVGNLNQIIDAVTRDGYAIAQEYLPDAARGDIRLFLMNGEPLKVDRRYCAFRRIAAKGDVRSNVHAGGKLARARITDEILELSRIVRPRLIQDGMFLVGLDIVGTKLMEVNVFSPGGLKNAARFERVDFAVAVVEALEAKVRARSHARGSLSNRELATL
jgi:glutathione synthase